MIDISIVWQKIKLVFSFLKFPKDKQHLSFMESWMRYKNITQKDLQNKDESNNTIFCGKHCCITPQYLPIIEKFWSKKQEKHFKIMKINYKTEDDMPF